MSEDLHESTGAYALDALDEVERRRYEGHLERCDACRAELDGFAATTARLGASADEQPPASLRTAVLARIDTTPQVRPRAGGAPRRRAAVPRWTAAAAAAAAVGVVVAVGAAVALGRDPAPGVSEQVAAVLAADDVTVVALEGTDGANANFHYAASEERGVLSAQDLAPLDDGRVYELWILRDDAAEPAGLFEPDADGRTAQLVAGLEDASGVAVSIESEGGVPAPAGPIVLQGEVPGS